MATAKIIEIVIMEGIAAVFFAFAYFIGVKARLEFIAGYNERTSARVKDKDGLKRLITRLCIVIGTGSALMPFTTSLLADTPCGLAYATGGYGGFILGVVALIVLQSSDYIS